MFSGGALAEFAVPQVLGFAGFLEPRSYLRYHVHIPFGYPLIGSPPSSRRGGTTAGRQVLETELTELYRISLLQFAEKNSVNSVHSTFEARNSAVPSNFRYWRTDLTPFRPAETVRNCVGESGRGRVREWPRNV